MSNHILIVDDEQKIARFLELELKYEGYDVKVCNNGSDALELFKSSDFDLIILDVMMTGLSGIEVLRRIRQVSKIPIIMLTAKSETVDKVMGLDLGADDYLTKPFEIEELLARIRNALKRSIPDNKFENIEFLKFGLLNVDLIRHKVTYDNDLIELTKKEFDLLSLMLKNSEIVLTRERILAEVWGYDFVGDTNVVDVYIRYIRSKIDDKYSIKLIHTIRGVGYVIKDETN